MALQQLLCGPDTYRWALRHVADFLAAVDAVGLALMALESRRADLRGLLHWLLHGDAPFPPLDATRVLFTAARLGLWPTAATLLHELQCDKPTPARPTSQTGPLVDQDPWRQLSSAFNGAGVEFPVDVLEAAATRGDLAAVQWLLPRIAKGVNTVTMGTGRQVAIPEDDLDLINTALLAAAEARQLHVVDWLVTATPRIHCVLPLDDELRAVAWYYTYEDTVFYFRSATAAYGMAFAGASSEVASGDGRRDDRPTHMPLATGFARDGKLAVLAQMYARANHRALIAPHAMEAAAAQGRLDVVQWLHERFPTYLSPLCLTAAAKGGHMHVLEWLEPFQFPLMNWRSSINSAAWDAVRLEAIRQATKHGHRDVVQYYHEECGTALSASVLQILSACKSVETVEYILDRVQASPTELQQLLHFAASDSNLAVVECLVTQRRLWSREAFEAAVYRERSPRASEEAIKAETQTSLAVSQFLMQQACVRAETLRTPLKEQVTLDDICIMHLADLKNFEIAEWVARDVPEADCDPNGLLDGDNYPPPDTNAVDITRVVLACLAHRHGAPDARRDRRAARNSNTRDGRFMVPPMSRMTSGTLSTDIVTWAASHGIRSVLERVYAQESQAKRQRLLQLIATRGAEHGHVDVLDWVRLVCDTDRMPKVIVFNEVASAGARCGRTDVLQWLHDQTLLPLADDDKVAAIVREAARHRRVDCLRWLLANVDVPTRVVAQILVDAAKKGHLELVRLLTARFAPAELSLSKADAARVRAVVQRQM